MSTNQPSLQPTVEDYSSDCTSSEESSSPDTVESNQQPQPQVQASAAQGNSAKVNAASDSGYSSRTAATGDSLDSAQSSDKTAVPAPAAVQPTASPKKKKKRKEKEQEQEQEQEQENKPVSNEASLKQNPPVQKQVPQRSLSRKDTEAHNSLPYCLDCEQDKSKQSSSRSAPRGPFSAPLPYPYPTPPVYSVPPPLPIFHPGNRPFISTNTVRSRPSPTVIQNLQPRTSSLAYAGPQVSPQEPRHGAGRYYHPEGMRSPQLIIQHPMSRWPSSAEVPHSARTSPTYHQPLTPSSASDPRHRVPSSREWRPPRPNRPARPVSLYAPEIHYDQDINGPGNAREMYSQPALPPRRDSYGSAYPTSVDDIYVEDGKHHYEGLSEDEYDDADEYDNPNPNFERQYRLQRHTTGFLPARPSRPRPTSSYSSSRSPLRLDQYERFDDRLYQSSDPRSVVRAAYRSDPSVARFRRPSNTTASSIPYTPASYGPRYADADSDGDHQNAAAYHRAEVEAERYQAERSGYPRYNNVRQLEDVKRMGREHFRNETRSQADSSHEGSSASDALKLTINNQTLTITQGEGGNPEIVIESNRRQTKYIHEGSMRSSGATSRSSKHRPPPGSTNNQAVVASDGKTRQRQSTSRKPSSASRYQDDDHNNENM